MKIYDKTKCQDLLDGIDYQLEEGQLCAGGETGRDSCFGDSGSALMKAHKEDLNVFETWKLIGIVSFGISGKKCAIADHPGVYTNVNHYIPWILDAVRP